MDVNPDLEPWRLNTAAGGDQFTLDPGSEIVDETTGGVRTNIPDDRFDFDMFRASRDGQDAGKVERPDLHQTRRLAQTIGLEGRRQLRSDRGPVFGTLSDEAKRTHERGAAQRRPVSSETRVEAERPHSELGRLGNDNVSQTKPRRVEQLRGRTPGCPLTPPATQLSLPNRQGGRGAIPRHPDPLSRLRPSKVNESFREWCREQDSIEKHGRNPTTADHVFAGLRRQRAEVRPTERLVPSVTGSDHCGSFMTRSETSFTTGVRPSYDGENLELDQTPNPWTDPRPPRTQAPLLGRYARAAASREPEPSPTLDLRRLAKEGSEASRRSSLLTRSSGSLHRSRSGAIQPQVDGSETGTYASLPRAPRTSEGDYDPWANPAHSLPVRDTTSLSSRENRRRSAPGNLVLPVRAETNRANRQTVLTDRSEVRSRHATTVTPDARRQLDYASHGTDRVREARSLRRDYADEQDALEQHDSISNVSSHIHQQGEPLSELGQEVRSLEMRGRTHTARDWTASEGRRITPIHDAPIREQSRVHTTHFPSPVQETEEVGTTGRIEPVPTCLDTRSAGSGSINYANHALSRNSGSGLGRPNTLVAPSIATPPVRAALGQASKVKLRTFAGDGTEAWSDFLVHLEIASLVNAWEPNTMRLMLMSALTGPAIRHLKSVPAFGRLTLKELLGTLESRFGREVPRMTRVTQFNNRVRGPQETYQELGDSLLELAQFAYPDLLPIDQMDAACIRFREAVRHDDKVGFYVNHFSYGCMQDLVEEADLVTSLHSRGSQRQSRTTVGVHLTSTDDPGVHSNSERNEITPVVYTDQVSELVAKIDALGARQRASFEARTCWNCQAKGHIAYDCPEPRKDKKWVKKKKKSKKETESSSETDRSDSKPAVAKNEDKTKAEPKPEPKPREAKPSGNDGQA